MTDHPAPRMCAANEVCVVTTVHSPNDTRIFRREIQTLAEAGYKVTFVAPEDSGFEAAHASFYVPLPKTDGRLARITLLTRRAFREARDLPHAVVHIHDPEMLFAGWRLARMGRAVLYDAHEDTPAQIRDKDWIPRLLQRPVAWAFDKIERRLAHGLAGVITATEKIAERFPSATVVHNYPDLKMFPSRSPRTTTSEVHVVYVGGLTRVRGATQMVRAMNAVQSPSVILDVVGGVQPTSLAEELRELPGASRTRFHGQQSWDDSWRLVSVTGDIGLLLYQPARNHFEALPTKLFEYMAAGLPVIASDFPLWRRILTESGAGLLVDPENPRAIAEALDRLIGDPELRRTMGARARRASVENYNWDSEAEKLRRLYREVMSEHR